MKIAVCGNMFSGRKTFFSILKNMYQEGEVKKGGANLLTVNVFDPDIKYLSEIFKPKKTTYTKIIFGIEENGGFSDAKYIASLRNYDGLLVIVDCFSGRSKEEIQSEIEGIIEELNFQDYAVLEKRFERLQKDARKKPELKKELEIVETVLKKIENKEDLDFEALEDHFKGFGLFALKPKIFVLNYGEDTPEPDIDLKDLNYFRANLKIEEEISLMQEEERYEFYKDLGIDEPVSSKIIRKIYELAGLISFYTVGSDEVRAWTVKKGATAKEAAAKIHTTIAEKFINAEVVSLSDFKKAGSLKECKRLGLLRREKKDYIVSHQDIISFNFNKG